MAFHFGKNWAIYKLHDKMLRQFAAQYLKGRLLDIGCGKKPYKTMLAPYVKEHIGVEHEATLHGLDSADLIGTAYAIPVEDAYADCAISTAVLEHLEEPERALREAYRVLKPGAPLIISAPFIWHEHEVPRDFFRYSRFGLAYLLEKSGFEVVEMKALGGFWVTITTLLAYYISLFDRGVIRYLFILRLLSHTVQFIGYALEHVHHVERWTWMNMAVAIKKPVG